MKKFTIVLLSVMIISVFVFGGIQAIAAEKTYKWKMAQYHPVGTMLDKISRKFIEKVEKASNGRITIKYYPGELLGDYIVQQEAVQSGALEFAYTGPVTKTNPKWDIFTMGYTGWNIDQAEEKFGQGGWLFSIWDSISEECNWKLLSIAPGGSAVGGESIISNKSFDPLDPEGIKLRVMPSDNLLTRFKALGFNPVIMPFSEVSSALALGTIDASAGCIPQEYAVFGDTFKYAYALQDTQTAIPLIMNLDLWKSLSEEDQALLMEAADFTDDPEFGWDAWKAAIVKSYNEDLLPWQIVVTVDGDGWATLAEKAREKEWAHIESVIGEDLMNIIKENVPELPWGLTLDEMNYGWGEVLTTEWLVERQGAVYTKFPPEVNK